MESETIISELERRANELESEANKLRSAVQVLRGGSASAPTRVPRTRRNRSSNPNGTMPMILSTLGELGPMNRRELVEALLSRGWETSSETPMNTMRTALRRLDERGDVVALPGGVYEIARGTDPVDTDESGDDERAEA